MSNLSLVERIRASCCKGIAALALLAASGCGAVSMYQQDYPKKFSRPPLEYLLNKGKTGDERLALRASPTNKYALLVKGKDNGIFVDGDIKNMAKLLLLKGYDIYYINPQSASTINHFCDALSGFANDETKFFLLLTGHGAQSGFRLKPWSEYGVSEISPDSLFHSLKKVRGKKAVMINCCYSGIFYEDVSYNTYWLADKSRYFNGVLFASCPSDKTSVTDPLLGMSSFVYGFCNFFVPEVSEEVDLSRISFSQEATPALDFFVLLSRLFVNRISYNIKTFSTAGYKF